MFDKSTLIYYLQHNYPPSEENIAEIRASWEAKSLPTPLKAKLERLESLKQQVNVTRLNINIWTIEDCT